MVHNGTTLNLQVHPFVANNVLLFQYFNGHMLKFILGEIKIGCLHVGEIISAALFPGKLAEAVLSELSRHENDDDLFAKLLLDNEPSKQWS